MAAIDLKYKELISADKISSRIKELGREISQNYSDEIVCICVLKGAVVFYSDLIRQIQNPVLCEFIGLKSYEGTETTGHVQITSDLSADICGKDVLVIEDIIDSGITMDFLLNTLRVRSPKSLEICTLLSKPQAHILKHEIKYTGFEISNEFVIGYGLDYNGSYRNLPFIAQVQV